MLEKDTPQLATRLTTLVLVSLRANALEHLPNSD
jgi:hypothetical protein